MELWNACPPCPASSRTHISALGRSSKSFYHCAWLSFFTCMAGLGLLTKTLKNDRISLQWLAYRRRLPSPSHKIINRSVQEDNSKLCKNQFEYCCLHPMHAWLNHQQMVRMSWANHFHQFVYAYKLSSSSHASISSAFYIVSLTTNISIIYDFFG